MLPAYRTVRNTLIKSGKLSSDMLKASLMAQTVKNLPAMWETWVRSLGLEDPLEKGIATHSSILPGEAMDRGT